MRKRKFSLKHILSLFFIVFCFLPVSNLRAEPKGDLFDMSIQELMNVEIQGSSALTQTTRKLQPSTVTTITREQIAASGARSLDELLDIYVPNLQIQQSQYRFQSIGLRGISSMTADKLLLLVNGKELNEHTNYGAISERDLPMLTDIHHIDVVRGPGSALYGVGALAMVINIVTENANTFQGQQVTIRTGQIERFNSLEYKMGKKFKDDSGLYIYTGIARNFGSNEDYSQMTSAYASRDGWYVRDQEGYRNIPKLKFYIDYMNGPFELWARYTRGGTRFDRPMHWVGYPSLPSQPYQEQGYQQLLLGTKYTFETSDKFKVESSFSYDMFDSELYYSSGVNCSREDKYTTKLVATWTPNDKHSVALGASWVREFFGLPSLGYPGQSTENDAYNPGCMSMIYAGVPSIDWVYDEGSEEWVPVVLTRMPRWTTDTLSLFGEHQWKLSDQWTNFFGMRVDKNTFTDYMFSPRDTLIYAPTDKDTFKFMFSRSVRLNFASEMYLKKHPEKANIWAYDSDTDTWYKLPADPAANTKPEVLYAYEFRYERQQTKNLWLAGSLFFHDHSIKGYTWEAGAQAGTPLGEMRTYGIELEGIYKKGKNEFIASHSFTKMYKFSPVVGGLGTTDSPYHYLDQMFTSSPGDYGSDNGIGNNLAYWANHQTKLIARRQVDDKISIDGSLRILWGFPGADEYNKWRATYYGVPRADRSIFAGNVLLNLGLTYKASKDLDIRLDGYNLLGFFDKDLNQNLITFNHNNASARSSAPAFGVSLKYTF
jgi:outer membrane receptor for ferrienterochelin and colicins